jgi:hypothetical protein
MDILEALDSVRAELSSVGIRAEVDPRDVNPPGAWIALNSIEHGQVMCGGGVVRTHVYLIVPDTGVAEATTQLSELLTSALRVFDPDDSTTATTVQLPGGGNPLPAFRLTIDVQTD